MKRGDRTTRTMLLALSAVALLLLAFIAFKAPPFDTRPLSVLMVTVDSLRADHVGCLGYGGKTTPTIDALAREGVLFEQAVTQATWTWPSVNSIISSTYPSTNGTYAWNLDLPAPLTTLPEILKARGYGTAFLCGGGHMHMDSRGRWNKGFDVVVAPHQNWDCREVTRSAISWLAQRKGAPFFLWIHFMDAHMSYLKNGPTDRVPLEPYLRRYDDAVRSVDAQVAVLLDSLKSSGRYDDTLVIVGADHGDVIGRSGLRGGHGGFVWDELLRVPLVMVNGRRLPAGSRIARQVEYVDIAPTICELTKAARPATFEGRSLVATVQGKEQGREYAFSEHVEVMEDLAHRDDPSKDVMVFSKYSVRSKEWKYITTTGPWVHKTELFDLRADPGERKNLAASLPERVAEMSDRLEEWLSRRKPVTPAPVSPPDGEMQKQMMKDEMFRNKLKEDVKDIKYLQ